MNKKTKIIIIIILILLIVLSIGFIYFYKKDINKNEKTNIKNLESTDTMIYLGSNSTPVLIENYDYSINTDDDIFDLLDEVSDMYGFTDSKKEFRILKKDVNNNTTYYRLQQKYNNIDVYGYQLVVSVKDNKVLNISGRYEKNKNVNTYRNLTDEEINEILSTKYEEYEILEKEKVIYMYNNKSYSTYKIDLISEECERVFIDINTKDIIDNYGLENTEKEKYMYTGKDGLGNDATIEISHEKVLDRDLYYFENLTDGYRVIDGSNIEMSTSGLDAIKYAYYYFEKMKEDNPPMVLTKEDGILVYNDISGYDAGNLNLVTDGISVMNNMQKVFNFYKKIGRNSVDNEGMKVKIYLDAVNKNHFFKDDEAYVNASWNKNNFIVIGSMDGVSLGVATDVLGHEFTHGVIQYTAGLIYKDESGALNESYADILGSLIEGKNFTLGEDIKVVRDMGNPNNYDNPSIKDGAYYFPTDTTYYDEEWKQKYEEFYEKSWTTYDNGGVHHNSGVPNYAAYLAYTNGAYKDKFEMAQVYYESLLNLTPNSTFEDSALQVLAAAKKFGLSSDKIKIIEDAFIKTKMLEKRKYNVSGKVTDENGNAISEVLVKAAYKENPSAYFVTYTDEEGNYSFENLPESEYIITCYKGKYEEKSQEIKVEKEINDANIALKIIDSSTKKSEVIFVMDISLSMNENDPNDRRKTLISNIVNELSDDTKIALVVFAKNSDDIINGISSKVNNKFIVTDVYNITNDSGNTDNSGTNGAGALNYSLNLFSNNDTRKYIVFFTDGVDNAYSGGTYSDAINKAKDKNVRIITIGIGKEIDSKNLTSVASSTNGKYYNCSSGKLSSYTKLIYDEIK